MGNHQQKRDFEWTPKMGLINGIPLGISPPKMGIAFGNRAVCYGELPFFGLPDDLYTNVEKQCDVQ